MEEFEFDLSDVDVAAFESVATEDITNVATREKTPPPTTQSPVKTNHTIQPPSSGKILLVPINSKHLFQPIQVGKQVIHLAPLNTAKNSVTTLNATPDYKSLNPPIQKKKIQSPPVVSNEIPKRKPCNCTKSQCLKLYCDCFANGEFCSGCNCTNCFNSISKEKERQKAISQCLERNPEAFRPKIGKAIKSTESVERRHTKGCNCKRSGCLKNYCECYEAKILCSNLCKCCGCKNYEESFERRSLMQLANSSSDTARGILKNLLPTNINSTTGEKCFLTDKVIRHSLNCLLKTAQKAEKEGLSNIADLIQVEMGKCLRMIVDSAIEQPTSKKR